MEAAHSQPSDANWKNAPHTAASPRSIGAVSAEAPAVAEAPDARPTEATPPPAKAAYEQTEALTPADVNSMHALFCQYYENTDLETFTRDLSKKDGVVLLREKASGRIRGFSTIMRLRIPHEKGEAIGFFSGDTIVDRPYWGGSHMRFAFLGFLVREKLRHFGRPIYWFLICKGYKTYLLMANNMERYFPAYDSPDDPFLKSLVATYCQRLYPENFRKDRYILEMGDGAQHLKGEVAPITPELREKYPKIRFFDDRNPNWRMGDELPCAGEITIPLILRVGSKFLGKMFRK